MARASAAAAFPMEPTQQLQPNIYSVKVAKTNLTLDRLRKGAKKHRATLFINELTGNIEWTKKFSSKKTQMPFRHISSIDIEPNNSYTIEGNILEKFRKGDPRLLKYNFTLLSNSQQDIRAFEKSLKALQKKIDTQQYIPQIYQIQSIKMLVYDRDFENPSKVYKVILELNEITRTISWMRLEGLLFKGNKTTINFDNIIEVKITNNSESNNSESESYTVFIYGKNNKKSTYELYYFTLETYKPYYLGQLAAKFTVKNSYLEIREFKEALERLDKGPKQHSIIDYKIRSARAIREGMVPMKWPGNTNQSSPKTPKGGYITRKRLRSRRRKNILSKKNKYSQKNRITKRSKRTKKTKRRRK